jgi:uncharacterized protein with HEPN domain
MPSARSGLALVTIRDNAVLACSFVADMTVEAFTADRRTFYAVTRCLEIISEAARRLDEATTSRHPQIPWRQIAGAGNVYRHDYDNVVEAYVWETVQTRLPELIAAAEAELAERQT